MKAVNDDSDCVRTIQDVKKKWKDLLSKARKDASQRRNHPTGGGPPYKASVYSDIIIDAFGGHGAHDFAGLNGEESGIGDEELSISYIREEEDCEGM